MFNLEAEPCSLFVRRYLFGSQELEPEVGEELCKLWDVVLASLVDVLPGQPTTPTDLASHLYQHSQILPNPPPVKPHKQMLVTPLSNKCTLHTSPPFLFHPCPLSSPPSCGNPAHDCRCSRRFSVWSLRSVSGSLSGYVVK